MNISNKNQYRKGITLMVLVITIIVMLILASVTFLTLTNFGILDKAYYAVNQTNLKEVQEYASVGWTKAYIAGARDIESLQAGVYAELEKLNIYENDPKYNIVISESEVTVTLKDSPSEENTDDLDI